MKLLQFYLLHLQVTFPLIEFIIKYSRGEAGEMAGRSDVTLFFPPLTLIGRIPQRVGVASAVCFRFGRGPQLRVREVGEGRFRGGF